MKSILQFTFVLLLHHGKCSTDLCTSTAGVQYCIAGNWLVNINWTLWGRWTKI